MTRDPLTHDPDGAPLFPDERALWLATFAAAVVRYNSGDVPDAACDALMVADKAVCALRWLRNGGLNTLAGREQGA